MSVEDLDLVEWREEFVSQERGSRVVHYYLEDSSGKSFLAVVGTERSLRHMLYVIADDFSKLIESELDGSASLKWRSRREVVDWLSSFLPKRNCQREYSNSPRNASTKVSYLHKMENGLCDRGSYLCKQMDHFNHKLKGCNQDIAWSGVYWTCGKQLKHYHAFRRNGTTIPSHSFVLVMSEEENSYLAYLEDMYEDKKGQKKVKVRWFHRHQEVSGVIPPPIPHPKEIFITPYSQAISAECVDDLASVLTPEHYEKCLAVLPYALPSGIHLCYRQYNNNKFKYFDLSTLCGYFDQMILSSLDVCTVSGDEQEEFRRDSNPKHGFKRIRSFRGRQKGARNHFEMGLSSRCGQSTTCQPPYQNMRLRLPKRSISTQAWFAPSFNVGDKIESLCQDSGIRGCWFRCTILLLSQKRLKVRYDDVQNEDGNGNLEEWILAFRPAAQDRLGMRCSGRLTVRPCRQIDCPAESDPLEVGIPVDAWWNDGWWEGVVIGVDGCNDNVFQVYLPGEDVTLVCQKRKLRISKDWTGERWVDVQGKPDVLSAISAVKPWTKLSTTLIPNKASDSGGSAMSEQKDTIASMVEKNEEEMKVTDIQGKPDMPSTISAVKPGTCLSMTLIINNGSDYGGLAMWEQKDAFASMVKRNEEEMQVVGGLDKPQECINPENSRKSRQDGAVKEMGGQDCGAEQLTVGC